MGSLRATYYGNIYPKLCEGRRATLLRSNRTSYNGGRSRAFATAAVRLCTSSFRKIRCKCPLVVPTVMDI